MRITAAISRKGTPAPIIETADLEEPRADEVLVRLTASGICHTDVHCHSGRGMPVPMPIVLGHEGAGIVEAVGAAVNTVAPGDHVVLSGASCGQCPSCARGRPTYCDEGIRLNFGGQRLDGSSPLSQNGTRLAGSFFGQSSFASHTIAPQRTVVKVPADVPLHLLAPLGCGIITGAGSILETFQLRPGQSVVVFGAGTVGLAAVMAARLAGASKIVAVDIDQGRLALARRVGATEAILSDAKTLDALRDIQRRGFDFTLNTTTHPDVFTVALECLAKEGVAGVVTRPAGGWTPNMPGLLAYGRKIQGILGGGANPHLFIPLMIDYWRQGRFPFDALITEFPFESIGEAWQACVQGQIVKPLLRM
jgi:aryl-alcohol dehydrogenase